MNSKININDKELRICANCRFFDPFNIQKKKDNLLGACKCNAPVPSSVIQNFQENNNKLGVFPLVLGSFWCGQFEFCSTNKEN